MTDEEAAMAYADGELDALAAKRFERRMATEPALAVAVEAHRALRARMSSAFAGIAEEPVPEALAAQLRSNVVEMPVRRSQPWWMAGAIAASLVIGLMLGRLGDTGPVGVADGKLVASGGLSDALDRQLASDSGDVRVLVSFRDEGGTYCRVFEGQPADGIACREGGAWVLRQTRAGSAEKAGAAYRQAGSGDAALMAAAQEMMAGDPLDRDAEQRARDGGWK